MQEHVEIHSVGQQWRHYGPVHDGRLFELDGMMKNEPTPTNSYRWVRLAMHCANTGDTPDSVHARRRKRQWSDGVQCKVGPDGNLYVNPEEYNKWVEGQQQTLHALAA